MAERDDSHLDIALGMLQKEINKQKKKNNSIIKAK